MIPWSSVRREPRPLRWLREFVGGGSHRTLYLALGLAAAAVAVRLFFWAYTDRLWEDALITVLHSENFGRGLGLTHFRIDEPPIHGFTSPISVLVPLLADIFHPGWGLILIRILSALAGGASVLMIFAINRVYPGLRLPLPFVAAAAGYVAIEHHQILWGMAGMETQLVVLTLLVALYAARARMSPYAVGAALAACMYARPDFGFLVLIIGFCLLARALREREWAPLFKAAAASALLYAPWVIFTTLYYGSPVPNTIHAKSGGYMFWVQSVGAAEGLQIAVHRLLVSLFGPQTPSFGGHGTGYNSLLGAEDFFLKWSPTIAALLLCAAGLAVAARRRQWDVAPIYGFFLVYTLYYVFLVPAAGGPLFLFGWYTVPMNAVAVLLAAKGAGDLVGYVQRRRSRPATAAQGTPVLWGAAAAYLCLFALVLPTTFKTEQQIQALIEWPVRKEIGLHLRRKNNPMLTVSGEPLGYVGYYSGLTYWDYPGLASRRVVAFLKANPGADLPRLMEGMRPDYLVLRRFELVLLARSGRSGWLRDDYILERRFTVAAADQRKIMYSDRNIDMDFFLFRKRAAPQGSAGPQ